MEFGHIQEVKLASCFRGEEFGISSVVFDPQEDLVWAATFGGHVTSFMGASLERYTAFQAHHGDIRQLQPTPNGILSITAKELRYTARTGLPLFTLRDKPNLNEMHCLLYLGENALLVGCHGKKIATVDLTVGQVTGETPTSAGVCLLRASEQYLCVGDIEGKISIYDPNSMEVVSTFTAHSGGLSDMEVIGHYLVTCGLVDQYGQLCVDPELMVFDLRTFRPLPSVTATLLPPSLMKGLPSSPSTVLLVSQLGQFQLLDLRGLVTPSTMMLHQLSTSVEGAMACAVDVSPSCQCLVFGDSCGLVHLWSDSEEPVLNPYAHPSILPDEVESPLPYISFDDSDQDSAPFSAVPMPLTHGPLLSDWPKSISKFARRRTPVIDPEILSNMKMSQFVGHAPKPPHIRRNQVPYDLEKDSGKEVPESPMMRESNPLSLIPKPYRQVEIKYSKLGIESFDFGHYNETRFAGLEIHIPNAYCNSMLQVLYFLEPVRCVLQNHLCAREFCLACELGFLFRMLDHSDGRSCQASNFLRAFRTLREASALGLLLNGEEEEKKANLSKLIQNWNRFMLQQLNQETQPSQGGIPGSPSSPTTPTGQAGQTGQTSQTGQSSSEEEESVVQRLFGCEVETVNECRCGWSSTRRSTELLFSLSYPHANAPPLVSAGASPSSSSAGGRVSFGSVLEYSICRQQRVHAWCENCAKYKSTTQKKSVCALPFSFSLNCQVESDTDREFWHQQQGTNRTLSWVPLSITVRLGEGGRMEIREGCSGEGEGEDSPGSNPKVSAVYDLMMAVGHVKEMWMEGPGNLVAHIRVGPSYHIRKEEVSRTQWYLFNDFAISPLRKHEVAMFPLEWLTPCILIYTQRDYAKHFTTTITRQLEPTVLLVETHRPRPVQSPATFTPLTLHELPSRGDVVGIDAEFVTLNQEEAEVKSDGTHTTLKPSQLSVARITVVRGKGPMEGSPFIDDYIATSEQVVDYLTKFSGIKPGDLDAMMSSKHLTTLKAAYLKLLYLLERGVKFVGHGLKKDFRVINILVPPDRVIDTVELFHLPKKRYVSLKFLAWFYIGLRVQEGAHDSAEDARTALLLYRKYCELETHHSVSESLRKLYEMGRNLNWQVPDS